MLAPAGAMARAGHHLAHVEARRGSGHFLTENSLSLVVTALFVICLAAQSLAGFRHYNQEREDHGETPIQYSQYLASGEFLEATMENWESEFLQMAVFLIFTAKLFQRGSAESRKPKENPSDRDPAGSKQKPNAPGPVRRGGLALRLYEHSLSITFLLLFLVSFSLHALGGARAYNEEQLQHGGETVSAFEYAGTSQFWFESMQNWQSEFLALAAMVVLSIYLRERGSPQSKPVDAPHSMTGNE
jgi:hypothetical protein